jgi:CheY-like chemotaxis protein
MGKPLRILVAEDEETDVFFLRYALRRAGLGHELVVAQDGQEAIDYLSSEGVYADRSEHPLPALVLLDLKMPRMTGFDVLEWLQDRHELRELPAVVLTSSLDESDRERAQRLGAADYVVKPENVQGLVKVVKELHARWLEGRTKHCGSF